MSVFIPPPADMNEAFKDLNNGMTNVPVIGVVFGVLGLLGSIAIAYFVYRYVKKNGLPAININTTSAVAAPASSSLYAVVPDSQIRDATVERFLKEIAGEKPIRFTRSSSLASPTTTRSGSAPAGWHRVQGHAPQRSCGRREAAPRHLQ